MQHTKANGETLHSTNAAPDVYVGYEVRHPCGRKIGIAREVFAHAPGEPEYVRLRMGAFGRRSILLPVRIVSADRQRRTLTLG